MNFKRIAYGTVLCLSVLMVPAICQSPAQPAPVAKAPDAPAPQPNPDLDNPLRNEPGVAAISVEVNEVIVPVTVTDDKGRFVSNLEKKDFQILDEGKPQEIRFFSRERSQPVVSGILLDLSNSSRTQWKSFQSAATEVAQRNLVTIYGISTVSYGFTSEGSDNLTKLAEETGGRVEYPLQHVYKDVNGFTSTPSDEGNLAFKAGTGGFASALASSLFGSIANIAGEITTQYILRYTPKDEEASTKAFRELTVKVALPDVKVRARKGYYPVNH
jgi:hypothetical protein